MAHNDYYGAGDNNYNRQPGSFADYPTASPSPVSYHQGPPPYNSPSPVQRPGNDHGNYASPFDTAFDDHVYPMNANSRNPSPSVGPYSSTLSLSQPQDTAYYGANNLSPEQSRPYPPEAIPLQDRNKDAEMGMNDHVYDAPGAAAAAHDERRRKKKGKVGLGELGMFGAGRKRIPWVVYILTVAQVIVFIVEIARNGKSRCGHF